MKNLSFKRNLSVLFIISLFFCSSFIANAQDEFSKFINSSKKDANKITKVYAGPMLKAIGNNFNNGWYTTAEPLKKFKFDFRLIASFSFVSEQDKTFDLNALDLKYISSDENKLPTILGKKDEASTFTVKADDPKIVGELKYVGKYKIPTIGIGGFPGLTPQLSIGLPKDNEFMFRLLPPLKYSSFGIESLKTSVWGIGLKHNIKQWIPGIKHLPFSMSLMGTYSNSKLTKCGPILNADDLLVNYSEDQKTDILNNQNSNLLNYDEQLMKFNTTSWNLSLLVSKKLPFITFFGGLGLTHSDNSVELTGNYPYLKFDENENEMIDNIDDPIDIGVDETQFGITAGMRFKLAFSSLTVSGTYSPDGYSSVTAALGFGNFN